MALERYYVVRQAENSVSRTLRFHLPSAHAQQSHGKGGKGKGGVSANDVAFSKSEKDALKAYTTAAELKGRPSYSSINKRLRNNPPPPEPTRGAVPELTSAIDKSELLDTTEVYRGVGGKVGGRLSSLDVGDEITDHAFMSTSTSRMAAFEFTDSWGGGNAAILEIKAPAGTKAVPMNKYRLGLGNERELLIQRGQKMRVTGRSTRTMRTSRGSGFQRKTRAVEVPVIQMEIIQ